MTRADYLQDTYLFESQAVVAGVKDTERGRAVILDRTIFYPQGGGQPADNGKITADGAVFDVTDVRMDENGIIYHFGEYERGELHEGDAVKLRLDADRRVLNAKLHSAGHLLDVAVSRAGLTDIVPVKGHHFPDGSYVEYDGEIENPRDYIPKIEKELEELIAENVEVEKEEVPYEEALNRGIWAPAGKSARLINFKGYEGCGCGGTHVGSAGEIGRIVIRKISSKKGKTKIAYMVE